MEKIIETIREMIGTIKEDYVPFIFFVIFLIGYVVIVRTIGRFIQKNNITAMLYSIIQTIIFISSIGVGGIIIYEFIRDNFIKNPIWKIVFTFFYVMFLICPSRINEEDE